MQIGAPFMAPMPSALDKADRSSQNPAMRRAISYAVFTIGGQGKMNNKVAGFLFITAGLLFLFHDYYAGAPDEQQKEGGQGLNAVDMIMGFFMLGLGGYFIFSAG